MIWRAIVLTASLFLAGCGSVQTQSTSAASQTTSATATTPNAVDQIGSLCNRDEPGVIRQIVALDLSALMNGSDPPSVAQLQQAQNALSKETSDLMTQGESTFQADVSNEAQAIAGQLQGNTPVDVGGELSIALAQRDADVRASGHLQCLVPLSEPTPSAPAPSQGDAGTSTAPSNYRGPACTIPGPSGAPEPAPSCINQEGCRALTTTSGSIPCQTALSIVQSAIANYQQTDDLNPSIHGYACTVDPYQVACTRPGTSFSANFGSTGQQTGG